MQTQQEKRLASLNLAIALNARGGPGIVLATVAFDLGLISETFFVALVLTAHSHVSDRRILAKIREETRLGTTLVTPNGFPPRVPVATI